jgi:hypothetical protein
MHLETFGTSLHLLYSRKSLPASMTIQNKSYIIAFPLKTIAQKSQAYIRDSSNLYVTHHISSRSTDKINATLSELGIDPRKYEFNHTYMDNEAHLHIRKRNKHKSKKQPQSLSSSNTLIRPSLPQPMCNVIERSMVDVVLYPLVKNIGLIIPYEIIEDTPDEMILDSRLIEPAGHMDLFRQDLEKLL